jgi:hypothetical protein
MLPLGGFTTTTLVPYNDDVLMDVRIYEVAMITYSASVLNKIDNAPGTWNSLRIGVFREDGEHRAQIGEYTRNYTTLFRTFCPFTIGEQAFALYSPDYTATRIMELPSCRDIGGEEPASLGFCPVDYYIPTYILREYIDWEDTKRRMRKHNPTVEDTTPSTNTYYKQDERTGERCTVERPSYAITPITHYPFGFVAGCIWGDDSSWKIQYLDLSEADKGIIKRDGRFGYIVLPDHLQLKDAIVMGDYLYDEEYPYITIVTAQQFNLATGEMTDGTE